MSPLRDKDKPIGQKLVHLQINGMKAYFRNESFGVYWTDGTPPDGFQAVYVLADWH